MNPEGYPHVMSQQEILLIDLESRKIASRIHGHHQTRYVVRAAFGGASDKFICSGSEGSILTTIHHQN
jgi:hypothetical protein